MATPLEMPIRRKAAATTKIVYRTWTGKAPSTIPLAECGHGECDRFSGCFREWPACCETGDKSLARFTGCPICVL